MLTRRQSEASRLIRGWYKKSNEQRFILAGYAGTGKSYMIRYVIEGLKLGIEEVAYCTFTGKASLVLKRYLGGKFRVSTVHRLVYNFLEEDDGELIFELKKELEGVRLIVLDEGSMINKDLLRDLESFGILILVVGDHGQLPAIGKQANLMLNPDFILDEIIRQAEGNMIIQLSRLVREGKKIELGKMGDTVYVARKRDPILTNDLLLRADQVICGYNKTRKELNKRMRFGKGFKKERPEQGDKVIFTKNNWNKHVGGYNYVNGMVGYILNKPRMANLKVGKRTVWDIEVRPDFLEGAFTDLRVLNSDFMGKKEELSFWESKEVDRLEYGYAITCHKSQGSQFKDLVVWNEPFGEEAWRWTYTAITRAERNLIMFV